MSVSILPGLLHLPTGMRSERGFPHPRHHHAFILCHRRVSKTARPAPNLCHESFHDRKSHGSGMRSNTAFDVYGIYSRVWGPALGVICSLQPFYRHPGGAGLLLYAGVAFGPDLLVWGMFRHLSLFEKVMIENYSTSKDSPTSEKGKTFRSKITSPLIY